jgi:WD40 repeat protein
MTILRSLCSVAVVVLFFSVTAPVIQSAEFGNRGSVARYAVVEQRTELFAPPVTTAVSPDGHTIAIARSSGGFEKRNGRVELWDLTGGALQRIITGFDGPIWSMSFSKNGRSLITVSTEFRKPKTQPSDTINQDLKTAELKWWDVNSGEFLRRESLGREGILNVQASWSPAGDVLALVERYPRGQYVPIVRGQMVDSQFVNGVELKLGLFDAHSLETRTKIEGGQQTVAGETTFLARMAHPVFSSNGELLAAVNGTDVKLWTVNSGKKFRTIREFNGDATAIAFSPDGQLVAVAAVKGNKSEINVVEVSTGRLLNTLKLLNDSVACLQFAAQGRTLLIGTLQYEPERAIGTVKIWNVVDKRFFRFDVTEGKTVSSMTVIPNSRSIVLQSGSDVEVRDLNTWRVIHSFDPSAEDESESRRRSPFVLSANRAQAVAFSSDGITVSSVLPREIRTWDSRTGGVKSRLSREPALDDVIATSSNGELIAEATLRQVRLIEIRTGANKILALQTGGRISAIALSADGRSLATADEHGNVQFWEVSTGRLTKSFETGQVITAIAMDKSCQMLAAATAERSIGLWSVTTGTLKVELKKHQHVVSALAFSPDGRTLASGDDDRNLILWELGSGKATLTFEKPNLTVTSMAFSPNGQLLASGTGNESVLLWNVGTGRLERVLR